MKNAIIVRYRNRFGCFDTWIAPAFLTSCEIRWCLPGCEILQVYCYTER